MVVVGSQDALRLAVESGWREQRKSTLQHRIANLAVAAGANPNQKMQSFEAKVPAEQQAGTTSSRTNVQRSRKPAPRPMQPAVSHRAAQPVGVCAHASPRSSALQMQQQQQSGQYQAAAHPNAAHPKHGGM